MFLAAILLVAPLAAAQKGSVPVTIPDPELEDCIRTATGISTGTITDNDLLALESLTCAGAGVVDLTGLEFARALLSLDLSGNAITDISPLAGLIDLNSLNLSGNGISDLSPLAAMSILLVLDVSANQLTDVTPLSSLGRLTNLFLSENRIQDVFPLGSLTAIAQLDLRSNLVSDVSTFLESSTLGTGSVLELNDNPLSQTALCSDIPFLEGQIGVTVSFDGACFEFIVPDVAGLQQALAETVLSDVGFAVGAVTSESSADIPDGAVIRTTPAAGTQLSMGNDLTVDLVVSTGFAGVQFADANLEACVRAHTAVPDVGSITFDHLANVVLLNCSGMGIRDLGGLENLINLQVLSLSNNLIFDASELAELANLTFLDISGNGIRDLDDVQELANLTTLRFGRNPISDLSPLVGLTALEFVSGDSTIVSDLGALAGLTNLQDVDFSSNDISDLSPLQNLTNLSSLDLDENQIADVTSLQDLPNLANLFLAFNNVVDVAPLANNTGLAAGDSVDLRGNPLDQFSLCLRVPQLEKRGVNVMLDPDQQCLTLMVPDIEGLTPEDAVDALLDLGLVPGGTIARPSDTASPGEVIGVAPPVGSTVPFGSTVQIIVAHGIAGDGTVGFLLGDIANRSAQPISCATVVATSLDNSVELVATADLNGFYFIPFAPPGEYVVDVFAAGFANFFTPGVTVDAGAETVLDLELRSETPDTRIFGRVTEALDGAPIGGVRVSAFRTGTLAFLTRTFTCASGDYELNLDGVLFLKGPTEVTVVFESSEHETEEADVDLVEGDDLELNASLMRKNIFPGMILGTVLEAATDNPIQGAQVTAQKMGEFSSLVSPNTPADGAYSISGVGQGSYVVEVSAVGFAPAQSVVMLPTDDALAVHDFELEEGEPVPPMTTGCGVVATQGNSAMSLAHVILIAAMLVVARRNTRKRRA